jgi:hypothetical protein
MEKQLKIAFWASVAGANAIYSARYLIDYANERTAAMQSYLSGATELTSKVIESARKSIEGVGTLDGLLAVAFGVAAGCCAGFALYEATKKEE